MKNILITGGPVHAHIDSVKIVTNAFKGGFMAELATRLSTDKDANVTYLCSKASDCPAGNPRLKVIYHNGFQDYQEKVLKMAPEMDSVILGAAVANLIPYKPIEGKFPSHNYKPGDLVPLIFQIAPRIIDEVKKVAPKTHLFGFKLLDGVNHDELVQAAYGVLLESHATAVIANDKQDLTQKYIVTKERAVHKINYNDLSDWIWDAVNDEYFKTNIDTFLNENVFDPFLTELSELKDFTDRYKWPGFVAVPEGYIFGTVAKRGEKGFWTTGRGKKENESFVFIKSMNFDNNIIYTVKQKATLNAPLLEHIFRTLPDVDFIAHSHIPVEEFPNLPYAPPGTVRDSVRDIKGSFNILEHGSFSLFDKKGKLL